MTRWEESVRPWAWEGDREVLETPIYAVREEQRRSPRTGRARPVYVIDAPDWVNVLPITPEGEVVMVAQWRHGIGGSTLELPAGQADPGETPEQTAARELREETGYAAHGYRPIGSVATNPAILSNRCTTVLAEGVYPEGGQEPDPGEDISVVRLPLGEARRLIAEGGIDHSLVVAAFYWLGLRESGG